MPENEMGMLENEESTCWKNVVIPHKCAIGIGIKITLMISF